MHRPHLPAPPVPGGFGFPLGFLTAILATIATVAAGATTHPPWALIALTGVVVAIAAVSTTGATIATAAVSWSLHASFVLGRHGELALTRQAARDAIILAATALLAALLAALPRASHHRMRDATTAIPTSRPATTHALARPTPQR